MRMQSGDRKAGLGRWLAYASDEAVQKLADRSGLSVEQVVIIIETEGCARNAEGALLLGVDHRALGVVPEMATLVAIENDPERGCFDWVTMTQEERYAIQAEALAAVA